MRGKPVLLLGAGGAGRAVAFALMDLGAPSLRIHDHDPARAGRLCADLAARFGADRCELATEPETAAAAVAGIVNATPVGMLGHPGLPHDGRARSSRITSSPTSSTRRSRREFVLAARRKGSRTMNGGGMCVHQAAEAFRHFTGRAPDVARMKRTFADGVRPARRLAVVGMNRSKEEETMRRIAYPILALLLAGLAASGAAAQGRIEGAPLGVDGGAVTGSWAANGHVRAYLGLPFAAPPLGDLRWKPPQPVTPWQGVRAATSFGPQCLQPGGSPKSVYFEYSGGDLPSSEDCLDAQCLGA